MVLVIPLVKKMSKLINYLLVSILVILIVLVYKPSINPFDFKKDTTKVEELEIAIDTNNSRPTDNQEEEKKEESQEKMKLKEELKLFEKKEQKSNQKPDKVTYNKEVYTATGIIHYNYKEARSDDLIVVDFSEQRLHKDAAKAFLAMKEAGLRGFVPNRNKTKVSVELRIVSGFRSIADQESIVKRKEATQSFEQIFTVSAPPGYSEHHTGYGLDINDLNQSFEDTDAYKFLVREAEKFGFELSFPRGNRNGIGYEPWHWRFIGTPEAQETFKVAREEEAKSKKENS